MANYTVKTKIHHNLDGPSKLSITATGDWKVLKTIENYALNYEQIQSDSAALRERMARLVEAGKGLWMLECAGFYPDCNCSVCKFRRAIDAAEGQ